MIKIHRKDYRYKGWKKRNDYKKMKNKTKRKHKKKKQKMCNMLKDNINKNPDKEFNVPPVFSIIENPEQTIEFLNDMIQQVEKVRRDFNQSKKVHIKLFKINMKETIKITGDALIYLLTIIRNTRGEKLLPVSWIGNLPDSLEERKFVKKSGYLNYTNTSKENLVQTNEHIQIRTGKGYVYHDKKDIDIRQEVIDFTCNKLNKDKIQLNYLMTMLTEMITNINDHAYDEENVFEHSWYIFVENGLTSISYTFIDNGLGIPTTIKKKGIEKLFGKPDWKYIEVGVSGLEKRSSTGKSERGNGLPSIYEQYISNKISDLIIISNKAYFSKEEKIDLKNDLKGTIFYWEIKKEEDINNAN